MMSGSSTQVRLETILEHALANDIRAYARMWRVPVSLVVEVACAAFLADRAGRADNGPFRPRLRQRRGPRAKVERQLSKALAEERRSRGGRPGK